MSKLTTDPIRLNGPTGSINKIKCLFYGKKRNSICNFLRMQKDTKKMIENQTKVQPVISEN